MKKVLVILAVVAVSMVFTSCASFEVVGTDNLNNQDIAQTDTTLAHVSGENWGFYFFSIPLVAGSTDEPGKIVFFKDTVNAPCMMNALTLTTKELGANAVYDITSRTSTFGLFLNSRSIQMSGNAVK